MDSYTGSLGASPSSRGHAQNARETDFDALDGGDFPSGLVEAAPEDGGIITLDGLRRAQADTGPALLAVGKILAPMMDGRRVSFPELGERRNWKKRFVHACLRDLAWERDQRGEDDEAFSQRSFAFSGVGPLAALVDEYIVSFETLKPTVVRPAPVTWRNESLQRLNDGEWTEFFDRWSKKRGGQYLSIPEDRDEEGAPLTDEPWLAGRLQPDPEEGSGRAGVSGYCPEDLLLDLTKAEVTKHRDRAKNGARFVKDRRSSTAGTSLPDAQDVLTGVSLTAEEQKQWDSAKAAIVKARNDSAWVMELEAMLPAALLRKLRTSSLHHLDRCRGAMADPHPAAHMAYLRSLAQRNGRDIDQMCGDTVPVGLFAELLAEASWTARYTISESVVTQRGILFRAASIKDAEQRKYDLSEWGFQYVHRLLTDAEHEELASNLVRLTATDLVRQVTAGSAFNGGGHKGGGGRGGGGGGGGGKNGSAGKNGGGGGGGGNGGDNGGGGGTGGGGGGGAKDGTRGNGGGGGTKGGGGGNNAIAATDKNKNNKNTPKPRAGAGSGGDTAGTPRDGGNNRAGGAGQAFSTPKHSAAATPKAGSTPTPVTTGVNAPTSAAQGAASGSSGASSGNRN